MELLKICLFFGLSIATSLAVVEDYPPKGFFTSDVTRLTWAHAVNSKFKLWSGLQDPSIRMLEADVVMGLIPGSVAFVPIMAHPPGFVSDLSFSAFLDDVIAYNKNLNMTGRKGIKLDFKQPKALTLGLNLLQQKHSEDPNSLLQFPIWINADVIPGPVNASTDVKVNGTELINLMQTLFPKPEMFTLSLGWTTRFVQGGGNYSKEQFNEMARMLIASNSTSPITFPLRAQLALKAAEDIKILLDQSGIQAMSPSVTLWEGMSDPRVTQSELEEFIQKLGKNRVFVDLPYSFPSGDDEEVGTTEKGPPGDSGNASTENGPNGSSNLIISNLIMSGLIAVLLLSNFH